MSSIARGYFGPVVTRATVCALGAAILALAVGNLAVAREWYSAWSYPTLLALCSSALVIGAGVAVSHVVELDADAHPRGWRLAWCWVQLWILGGLTSCAVAGQFLYAFHMAESGPAAGRLALLNLVSEQPSREWLLFLGLLVATPAAWVGLARIRRLPPLSQIGLAIPCSAAVAVVVERAQALFGWLIASPVEAAASTRDLASLLVDMLALAVLSGALSAVVVLSVLAVSFYTLADRLHASWLRATDGEPRPPASRSLELTEIPTAGLAP